MEDAGTQVAPPIFIHQQTLSSRFSMAKKRDLPSFQGQAQRLMTPTPALQYPVRDTWSQKGWEWDNVRFVAKPVDLMLGTPTTIAAEQKMKENHMGVSGDDEEDDRLRLNLGGGLKSVEEEPEPEPEPEQPTRPSKRVRSGSPGGGNYPMCQVDNCKEDLSNAKDYHRRHKVCELHSKASKALVANQMQRFCQQCSRLSFRFSFFLDYFGLFLLDLFRTFTHINILVHLFPGFIPFRSLMRVRGVVGVDLRGITAEEGKPNRRMLPRGCYLLETGKTPLPLQIWISSIC
jgi:hypothetical protein